METPNKVQEVYYFVIGRRIDLPNEMPCYIYKSPGFIDITKAFNLLDKLEKRNKNIFYVVRPMFADEKIGQSFIDLFDL